MMEYVLWVSTVVCTVFASVAEPDDNSDSELIVIMQLILVRLGL